MKNQEEGFLKGRIQSLKYTLRGAWLLLKTEHSVMVHATSSVIVIFAGLFFEITRFEWMIQLFGMGLVLTAESLNTAIEKLCDFVHPGLHEKIRFIKDVSAGAMTFAVLTAVILLIMIYYPYFF